MSSAIRPIKTPLPGSAAPQRGDNMSVAIRPIKTLDECKAFQDVERLVWGSDDESVMPIHVLVTISRNGGVLLGAYADDGPPETGGMVGIVLGWYGVGVLPGEQTPRLKLCSHMAGVLPQWQRQHVGMQLKLAQRAETLAQGFTDWITWTYDPLLRANAVFNIHRLGATCQTYIRNIYGEMTDALNAGSGPSDRCQVDWRLRSERVVACVARQSGTTPTIPSTNAPPAGLQVLPTRPCGDFRCPMEVTPRYDGAPLAAPLPDDILTLRRRDPALALAWRFYLRSILEEAFAAGYAIVDCLHIAQGDWCYILTPTK